MLKRLFSIITISLVLTGIFFSAYSIDYPVYADSNTDAWTQVTTNEQLVEAFKYYCKSRDLTIEGSIADGVTTFTTNAFNNCCRTLGIDITALQAEIKYQTGNNIGTRFLFSATGVNAFNRIFAQFLQDNDLEVGDSNVNKNVYSGEIFTDGDGYTCFVWNMPGVENNLDRNLSPLSYGSFYKYDGFDVARIQGSDSVHTFTFRLTDDPNDIVNQNVYYTARTVDYSQNETITDNYRTYQGTIFYPYYILYENINDVNFSGGFIIYRVNNSETLYFGNYCDFTNLTRYPTKSWRSLRSFTVSSSSVTPVSINIQSTTINNNTYEGDTIINNNGDIINNPDNPDNPDIPDPNPGPTPDPPTIPDDGGWQDFSLPEMPNDWLIYGMEKKFPFDIPFNIMFALSLLNHEPEIPKFEGDLDLQVCTWHYDIDLTPFDDIATILRRFEVLAFIIGLAILTKELINWG